MLFDDETTLHPTVCNRLITEVRKRQSNRNRATNDRKRWTRHEQPRPTLTPPRD
jgi:hypothetical protein